MVRITDQLLVSRAEHNDGHLPTLEEISLHQQKLERIEYINRVCSELKILHLQDNCIEKMENLGRLKMLNYLNLAMNNVEKIENTEPLEKLEKLDLTLNFIGELTSIEVLKCNHHLKSIFLMGNPCAQFDHYRDFVIATLPQIDFLDGVPVEKSARIKAIQALKHIRPIVVKQENEYFLKRQDEKIAAELEIHEKSKFYSDPKLDLDTQRQRFYESNSKHNPEYRKESMRFREYLEEMDEKAKSSGFNEELKGKRKDQKPRRLFDDNGKPLNVNEANIDFHYDDSDDKHIRIELKTYRFLDTSLIDLDVQPTYLRATIKGKTFQLRFLDEVNPDKGSAERSQVTGHIVITLPLAQSIIRSSKVSDNVEFEKSGAQNTEEVRNPMLEVTPPSQELDFSRIVQGTLPNLDDLPALEEVVD